MYVSLRFTLFVRIPYQILFGSLPRQFLPQFWELLGCIFGSCLHLFRALFRVCISTPILVHFRGGPPPGRGVGGKGGATCGSAGALHLGVRMVILPCVYAHSAQVPVKRPRDSHLSDLSQVTLQVPLGSCTGNFKKGRHWQKAAPHAGDGAKVTSSRGGFMGYALCRRPLAFLGQAVGL